MGVLVVLVGVWTVAFPAAMAAGTPPPPDLQTVLQSDTGGLWLAMEGSRATIEVESAGAVHVYVYPGESDPVTVGLLIPDDAGTFGVDLALMPAGEVTVAVLDEGGAILGWASTQLDEVDSNAPAPVTAPIWPWLIVAVALAVVAGLGVLVIRNRPEPSTSHETPEESARA